MNEQRLPVVMQSDYVNWHTVSSFICYAGVRTISSQWNLQETISTAHGNTNVSFLTSNKGNPFLVLDGFLLKTNTQTKIKKYWTCRSAGCRVSVHTDIQNALLKSNGEHDHLPQSEGIQIKLFREKVKNRVVSETTAIARIYEEEVIKADLSTNALANLPLAREIREFASFMLLDF